MTTHPSMVDEQGRMLVNHMSDRLIAEETLLLLRTFGDALQTLSNHPLLRSMMPVLPGM